MTEAKEIGNDDTDSKGKAEIEFIPGQSTKGLENLLVPSWQCRSCQKECIPVRSESRCICGHRLKYHKQDTASSPFRCCEKACECPSFFYIVAEGSWMLRCRCKHKHTDHDPASHYCKKCACQKFDSPWVCNCNHAWSDHEMRQGLAFSKLLRQTF